MPKSNSNKAKSLLKEIRRILRERSLKEIITISKKEISRRLEKYKFKFKRIPILYESNINKDISYVVMSKVASSAIGKAIVDFGEIEVTNDNILDHYIESKNCFLIADTKEKLDKVFNKPFKFTLVRNPFARLVSAYKSRIATDGPSSLLEKKFINKKFLFFSFKKQDTFNEFLNKLDFLVIVQDVHIIPQHKVIFYKRKLIVDFIGRFENLNQDYNMIAQRYSTKPLEHLNKSSYKSRKWEDYYTVESAKKVYQLYKKDFDLWYPDAYKELLKYLNKKSKNPTS